MQLSFNGEDSEHYGSYMLILPSSFAFQQLCVNLWWGYEMLGETNPI